jgi:protease I
MQDSVRNDAKAILSDAGLSRGKCATGWWSIKPDLENAGATYR